MQRYFACVLGFGPAMAPLHQCERDPPAPKRASDTARYRDMAEFQQFLVGRLTKLSPVAVIESSILLRRVKSGIARTP
ncbi:putative leucine-responsive regulatory protein (plasmid) [Phaeobacter porticola]|uniref:Putative leucine-responsive regulatory protein n=1 Tax=Phaeobacter porticola TaxID=1844006 RepID=A0A1L3IA29_9RHOB|nr:putative leucine-responsive regulatory protein [Phaeobacter porticola]